MLKLYVVALVAGLLGPVTRSTWAVWVGLVLVVALTVTETARLATR